MDPLRILYLITDLDVGGAEKALCQLVLGLDRERFDPTVACLTGRGELGRVLEGRGIDVVYLNVSAWTAWLGIWRLWRLLRRKRSDVLHSFLFHANLAGRLAALLARTPKVISAVRVAEPRRSHLWLDRLTQWLCDVETCVADAVRTYTHERAGVRLDKLVTVPNGIDVSEYEDAQPQLPAGIAAAPGRRFILTIGRIDRQKDPETFLRAAQRIRERIPEVHFLWAGDGPLRAAAERQAAELDLADAVHFLGQVAEVKPLLAAADVLVLASRWEGMPNAILEAMAAAKPVVATNVGGCPELIVDGETGFLVAPGDPKALAGRVIRLLENQELAESMGQAARQRAAECFTIERMVEANVRLYEAGG